jgi:glutamate-5-semialdehyde dehydrogenase
VESLVIDQSVVEKFVPAIVDKLSSKVTLVGDTLARKYSKVIGTATEEDWGKEYSDYKLSIKTVKNIQEAIAHISLYHTQHSDCIMTEDQNAANEFMAAIDSCAVLHNASTRFVDGGEFGFGAEIGISTQKIHARGPMGLKELTSYKYFVYGDGQIRS